MQTKSTPHILSFFLSLRMKKNRNTNQNTLGRPPMVRTWMQTRVVTVAGFGGAAAAVIRGIDTQLLGADPKGSKRSAYILEADYGSICKPFILLLSTDL